MKKYLLSSTIVLMSSAPLLAEDAGVGLTSLLSVLGGQNVSVEPSWTNYTNYNGSEIYENLSVKVEESDFFVGKAEIKPTSSDAFLYKMENIVSRGYDEEVTMDMLILSVNPSELSNFLNGLDTISTEGFNCVDYSSSSRLQAVNINMVSSSDNVNTGLIDISLTPVSDGGSCMLDASYNLQDISVGVDDFIINVGSISGNTYSSADYNIPSSKLSRDLNGSFLLKDLSFMNDSNYIFGGVQSIETNGITISDSMMRLGASKINLLINEVYSQEQIDNYDIDPNFPFNVLSNPEVDLAEIWNGFKEISGNSNLRVSNAYVSKDALSNEGIPIPQYLMNAPGEYIVFSSNLDFVKSNGDLTIGFGISAPYIAAFDFGIGLGMGEVTSVPTNPQMALMTLPIGIKSFSSSFKDEGLDSILAEVTGKGISDNVEYIIGNPIANMLPSNSQMIMDWISSGLDGSKASFSMNSDNSIPFMMLIPIAMGDWRNATSIFTVQSSIK